MSYLQVIKSPLPEWEAEYHAWAQQLKLERNYYKEYPALVRGCPGLKQYWLVMV